MKSEETRLKNFDSKTMHRKLNVKLRKVANKIRRRVDKEVIKREG